MGNQLQQFNKNYQESTKTEESRKAIAFRALLL
jgi:hypothetical protein